LGDSGCGGGYDCAKTKDYPLHQRHFASWWEADKTGIQMESLRAINRSVPFLSCRQALECSKLVIVFLEKK
ncbi:MAG TPA: hypothetical protein VEH26_02865, partial [Chthoniobacterales bacterium]|nr:hypothetical protein [Chthoniobacterales bacterium]